MTRAISLYDRKVDEKDKLGFKKEIEIISSLLVYFCFGVCVCVDTKSSYFLWLQKSCFKNPLMFHLSLVSVLKYRLQ